MHYFPALSAYISRFAGVDGGGSLEDARALNDKLLGQPDKSPWALPYVHAAFRAWWFAEYSGWYGENYDGTSPDTHAEQGGSIFT